VEHLKLGATIVNPFVSVATTRRGRDLLSMFPQLLFVLERVLVTRCRGCRWKGRVRSVE